MPRLDGAARLLRELEGLMVDQDECQDCGGMGAVYEHGRRCRTPDFCVGSGDYWSCVDGEWVPCPSCLDPASATPDAGHGGVVW